MPSGITLDMGGPVMAFDPRVAEIRLLGRLTRRLIASPLLLKCVAVQTLQQGAF